MDTDCTPEWQCSEWSECSSLEEQTRSCTDVNNCGTGEGKPIESRSCEVQVEEPEPKFISGSDEEATEKFKLERGLSVFEMRNVGDSNFAIWLLDDSGEKIELLVNEIGDFEGSTALGVDEGEYFLDLSGQDWEVNITQPREISTRSLPKTFAGDNPKATGFFKSDGGLARFEMKHKGESNFAVWLLDKDGNREELLANGIGDFEGSTALNLEQGNYLLDVDASGSWQIDIS